MHPTIHGNMLLGRELNQHLGMHGGCGLPSVCVRDMHGQSYCRVVFGALAVGPGGPVRCLARL